MTSGKLSLMCMSNQGNVKVKKILKVHYLSWKHCGQEEEGHLSDFIFKGGLQIARLNQHYWISWDARPCGFLGKLCSTPQLPISFNILPPSHHPWAARVPKSHPLWGGKEGTARSSCPLCWDKGPLGPWWFGGKGSLFWSHSQPKTNKCWNLRWGVYC